MRFQVRGGEEMAYDEAKFARFNEMLNEIDKDTALIVADPSALGDDYEELIENLRRIGRRDIALRIVAPLPRPAEASR
jgi:hypothetical protein